MLLERFPFTCEVFTGKRIPEACYSVMWAYYLKLRHELYINKCVIQLIVHARIEIWNKN